MNARQKALLRAVVTKRSPEHMELIDVTLLIMKEDSF